MYTYLLFSLLTFSLQGLVPGSLSPKTPSLTMATTDISTMGVEEIWQQAHSLYDQSNYLEAAKLYTALLERGVVNGYVYYNLGNSYLKAEQLGKAIAAYLRSLKYLPRNIDVLTNLQIARERTQDKLPSGEGGVFLETFCFWHYLFSVRELLFGFLSLSLILSGLVVFLSYFGAKPFSQVLLGLIFSAFLGVGVSLGIKIWHPEVKAVIEEPVVRVYAGTSLDSLVLFKLHEGSEVKVIDQDRDWLRISIPGNRQGWLSASVVAVIEN